MKNTFLAGLLLSLLAFLGPPAYPQATSRVAGTVQDKSGGVIQGASVTLTNEATNVPVNTVTTSTGSYVFDGIVPGTYTVKVQMTGFTTFIATGNVLTIAQPMVVNATMQVGGANEKVEVIAGAELVQTENSGDLGALIDQRALETLPIVGSRGRSPLDLLELIPGVVDGGPLNTGGANISGGGVLVNGARDRAWNYTLDGIDINETSAGGSNFSPLRTNPESIEGFRVITSNATSEFGRNSGAQVIMGTRQGTNEFHGNVFWFYQTPGLNANDPANKENGLDRPQFVQHIPGFSIGGPIFKNKTFFFMNMQFLHASQDFSVNNIVYTKEARSGLIRYLQQQGSCIGSNDSSCPHNDNAAASDAVVDSSGVPLPGLPIGTYNVVANDPAHIGLDPSTQKFIALAPLPNNFNVGDGLNTAGYQFQAPEQERQVDLTVRIDHNLNSKNSIFGRWAQGHQNTVGDTANAGLQPFPGAPNVVDTYRQPRNLAIGWRYSPNSTITNEAIAGMNRFIFNFANPDSHYLDNPPFVLNNSVTIPLQNYVGNKRALTTIQFVDNLTYLRGAHAMKFGTNLRLQRHIDDRGSIGPYDAQPLVFFNSDVNRVGPEFNLPGDVNIATDLGTVKGALNDLLGRVGNIQQGFVAKDVNQYAPAGTHLRDDFRMPEYDFYAQDSWKIRPNLTIDLGLRWEIKLSPRVSSNFLIRPDQGFTVSAPGSDSIAWTPGHMYQDAWKNFSPSIGVAWDPFKNGKQSIRANYRLAYDRMNTFVLSSSVFQGLPGETLAIESQDFGKVGGRVSDGIPTIAPPAGVTPASLRQPAAFSTTSITAVDPKWTPPQVSEWSLSVQRQVGRDMVAEVAYIGHHAVHLFGAYDSNQAQIKNNGFLDAFKTVAAGGDSPLIDQLLLNDPGRPAGTTGSQYLTGVCPSADCSGSPYSSDFSFGSVAAVAAEIGVATDANGVALPVSAGLPSTFIFKYPQFAGGFIVLDSGDWSWYNALQASFHGRFHGLQFQANYTWSKSMDTRSFDPTFSTVVGGSTTYGSSSTPFDIADRRLNYAPSDADRTHVFQAVWTYQVPFGKARKWGSNWGPALDRLVGGWEISGAAVFETGRPTTIYSPAYTTSNVVRTPSSCTGCTHDMLHIHYNPDFGGLDYLTTAQMGQFFDPAPGANSNVGRNFFRLAGYSVVNLSLGKVTQITEKQTIEFRVEMQNAFNSKHYDEPASIRTNSGFFGLVDAGTVFNICCSPGSNPRTIQLSAKFAF
ncbi:MAG: TonB-dependent receptor [Candidatus Acidiferrum sp.]